MKLPFPFIPGNFGLVPVAALLALFAWAQPGLAAPEWDVVGIKLGMTEQQARAAIKAHSAQAVLNEKTMKFTFNDGARQQETAAFIASISASIPNVANASGGENIQLEFSPPPQEQRVIRVWRTLSLYQDPPALERVLDSLTQKYGKPRSYMTTGIGVKNGTATWSEMGKVLCGGEKRFFIAVGQSPDRLRFISQLQKEKLAPADLSQCGAQMQATLSYREGGSSVNTVAIDMRNYDYALPALEATAKWLAGLEAQARKVRMNSGATPKL